MIIKEEYREIDFGFDYSEPQKPIKNKKKARKPFSIKRKHKPRRKIIKKTNIELIDSLLKIEKDSKNLNLNIDKNQDTIFNFGVGVSFGLILLFTISTAIKTNDWNFLIIEVLFIVLYLFFVYKKDKKREKEIKKAKSINKNILNKIKLISEDKKLLKIALDSGLTEATKMKIIKEYKNKNNLNEIEILKNNLNLENDLNEEIMNL